MTSEIEFLFLFMCFEEGLTLVRNRPEVYRWFWRNHEKIN